MIVVTAPVADEGSGVGRLGALQQTTHEGRTELPGSSGDEDHQYFSHVTDGA